MATKRQHFLPRLLQRNFASRVNTSNSEKKNYFCWVYSKTGEPYETNIINIAVESYFYSEPDEPDLENQIANFESRMSQLLDEFCAADQDTDIDVETIEDILRQPDIGTVEGIRDRSIMEVLYSTGIRRMELVKLTLYDVDHRRGTLMIREGKGKKDRLLPIGERALA